MTQRRRMREGGGGDGGKCGGGREKNKRKINKYWRWECGIQHADNRCSWRRKPKQEN